MNLIDCIFLIAGLLIALPIMLVALETAVAIGRHLLWTMPVVPADTSGSPRPPLAVLIPAHNEEAVITRTLASLLPQLAAADRLIVVADNCTDRTAQIARAAGAEVVERTDALLLGKGYALAAGIEHLNAAPPAVLVIVDADTHVSACSIERLACDAAAQDAPMQAAYQLDAPRGSPTRVQLSALAFTFKNLIRALGADALGIPCLLRGTGMAFPWRLVHSAKFATGNLVEDMQLGIDLTLAVSAPRFCSAACVTGRLPDTTAVSTVQRTRWEHGHMQTILHNVPALLAQGIRQRRPALLALACDLAVPPIALLVLAWCFLSAIAAAAWFAGMTSLWSPLALLAIGVLLVVTIVAGWAVFGRGVLPARALLSVPGYVLWKIPLYAAFLVKRQQTWIRTERAT